MNQEWLLLVESNMADSEPKWLVLQWAAELPILKKNAISRGLLRISGTYSDGTMKKLIESDRNLMDYMDIWQEI